MASQPPVNRAFNNGAHWEQVPNFGNSPQPPGNVRRKRKHIIKSIHYAAGIQPKGYDSAPMECECGWSGTAGEWPAHRGLLDANVYGEG